jgi:hypothetical protein
VKVVEKRDMEKEGKNRNMKGWRIEIKMLFLCLYWVPQNSRNNSMRQCQFMLENNEKNN